MQFVHLLELHTVQPKTLRFVIQLAIAELTLTEGMPENEKRIIQLRIGSVPELLFPAYRQYTDIAQVDSVLLMVGNPETWALVLKRHGFPWCEVYLLNEDDVARLRKKT
jgi:hypothetical protein